MFNILFPVGSRERQSWYKNKRIVACDIVEILYHGWTYSTSLLEQNKQENPDWKSFFGTVSALVGSYAWIARSTQLKWA